MSGTESLEAHELDAIGSHQHDEMRASDGRALPTWKTIYDQIGALSNDQIERHQVDIARQLRANGIAYSPLSEDQQSARPWNLDLAPFVIEPDDWATLSAGLEQRARLKRALLRDIYTDQSLIRDHTLPAALVYAHKGYLRDAVNPEYQSSLPLIGADVSRSPSGDWYIVDDICQYPAGIGYALENRLVLARTIPNLFRQARVLRIASYFKSIQENISELTETADRCVLLAYGPHHPHYFEFAFLAKYLGYTLVQTGDLTVRNNSVFLKTVDGLQRVSVILRFIDDTDLDPLAVGQSSARGITGLFQAVRAGGVKILNPLGSGVLDNPAFNICLPEICQRLLGEPLLMQGPPTYWLGNNDHHHHVLNNIHELLFRDIDSLGKLFDPHSLCQADRDELLNKIKLNPHRYVAQERLDRSIAPAFAAQQLVSQQVTVRLFLVEEASGYQAMPGGLCLLDTNEAGSRPSFDSLKGSKDTWVTTSTPVKPVTLLNPQPADLLFSVIDGELPSRVAENLFWMGRNAERCENCLRLLRSVFQTLQHDYEVTVGTDEPDTLNPALFAILRATTQATQTLPGFVGRGGMKKLQNPQKELLSLLHDPSRAGTLPFSLNQLKSSAAAVRDRVSDELLQVLNQLDDVSIELVEHSGTVYFTDDTFQLKQINNQLDAALISLSAFAGLAHENFTHGDGWRFMMLGRRLERINHTCVIIKTMLARDRDDTLLLETLLKLFDSVMTYRSRYRSQIDVALVLNLLLSDELNPRSLAFQFKDIDDHISKLPGRRSLSHADALRRLTISGLSRVQLAEPHALLHASKDARQNLPRLLTVLERLPQEMADILSDSYFRHVETAQQLSELSPGQPG